MDAREERIVESAQMEKKDRFAKEEEEEEEGKKKKTTTKKKRKKKRTNERTTRREKERERVREGGGGGTLKRRTFPHKPPKMRPGMVGPLDPRCPEADKNSYKTAYRCFLPFAPALLPLTAVSLRHLPPLSSVLYALSPLYVLSQFNLVS